MGNRHRVFISYHHANDETYRTQFEQLFADVFDILISQAVDDGDIDPNLPAETIRQKIRDGYIRDATVTVVLVGSHTWQRKHVDWEISASLRDTKNNPRNGLIGILLPTYRQANPRLAADKYDPHTIPPRLYDNLPSSPASEKLPANAFAQLYQWSTDPTSVQKWIHDAFVRRDKQPDPDNSRPLFGKNRAGEKWQP